jgi:hypothetical protein
MTGDFADMPLRSPERLANRGHAKKNHKIRLSFYVFLPIVLPGKNDYN